MQSCKKKALQMKIFGQRQRTFINKKKLYITVALNLSMLVMHVVQSIAI
jgi:hypothetical protein